MGRLFTFAPIDTWRLRSDVRQIVWESPHVDFESNNLFPPEFHNSTHILITTVQRLFNGLSVFRVANRPNPVKVGALLVDDAHACINIALEQFTATLPKTSEVGKRISGYFDEPLKQQMVGTYADMSQGETKRIYSSAILGLAKAHSRCGRVIKQKR